MKRKIFCTILAIVTLFSVFAIITSATSAVEHNTDLLYRELNAVQLTTREYVRGIAEILFVYLNVGKILEIQVNLPHVEHYSDRYTLTFSDEHGSVYSLVMSGSALIVILNENNIAVWGGSEIVRAPWWTIFPSWLQCVLRVVFFGWIWMR